MSTNKNVIFITNIYTPITVFTRTSATVAGRPPDAATDAVYPLTGMHTPVNFEVRFIRVIDSIPSSVEKKIVFIGFRLRIANIM